MNILESINILRIECGCVELDISNGNGSINNKNFVEMSKVAILAMEKQIPKKAKNKRDIRKFNSSIIIDTVGNCFCGKYISIGVKYCCTCGQAIDWSISDE